MRKFWRCRSIAIGKGARHIEISIQNFCICLISIFSEFSPEYGNSHWAPPEQFFTISPENIDFPKKLFSMKIFSIKFVIKKVILKFGVK